MGFSMKRLALAVAAFAVVFLLIAAVVALGFFGSKSDTASPNSTQTPTQTPSPFASPFTNTNCEPAGTIKLHLQNYSDVSA
jgi:hypothetical protein